MKPKNNAVRLLSAAALLLVGLPRLVAASANLTFALIPKNTANDFFSVVRDGCVAHAAILSAGDDDREITCLYLGPAEDDPAAVAGIMDDIVDGKHGEVRAALSRVTRAHCLHCYILITLRSASRCARAQAKSTASPSPSAMLAYSRPPSTRRSRQEYR